MREHAGFVAVIAGCLVALGAGLIAVGVVEAQAVAAGTPHLDLWGNAWFVLGICIVCLGAAGIVAACIMYVRKPRKGRELGVGLAELIPTYSPPESDEWAALCDVTGSGALLFKLHSTLATPSPEMRVLGLGPLKCRVCDPNGAYTESQAIFRNGGWVTAEYRPIYFPDMLEPAIAGRYEFTFYEQQSDASGSWLPLKSGSYDAETAPEVWE